MNFFTTYIGRLASHIRGAALIVAFLIPVIAFSQSPAPVNLNSAANFAILAGSTITSTGPTIVTGDVGLFPGSAITGFPPGTVIGTTHIDPIAGTAQGNLTTAFNDAAGRTTAPIAVAGNLGGMTLAPGLYKSTSSLAISSGDLFLDASGDPNAVWIFQMATTFTTTAGRAVILAGGAQAKNIFWQVGTSATIGTTSSMYGTIMADQSVSILTGATLIGRALARIAAVTCDANTVTLPKSTFTTVSRNLNLGSTRVDSTGWLLITLTNTGNDPLSIISATGTNPAFTSHLTGTLILPGGSVTDSIRYRPTTMGDDSGKLIFSSNGSTPLDTINVRGKGIASVFSVSSRTVNVGTTHVDSVSWTLVTISNTGNDTLRFATATSTSAVFSSHLSALKMAPGGTITDSIRFLPTTIGAASGKLIFTGNSRTTPDTITVNGIGRAAVLSVTSRNVDLGTAKVGTPTWTLVTLTNTGNDTLRIVTSTNSNPAFSSHLPAFTIAPGASIIDSVMFSPTRMGMDSSKMIITGNSTTSPDTILLRAKGLAAVLAASSRSVNCGATPVGTQTWTLITIANTGNDTLVITASGTTNPAFASHLSDMQIAPGGSIIDLIGFLPTTAGDLTGQLLFTSNATTSPDAISVYGTGVGLARTATLATPSRNVNCGTTQINTPTWTLITLSNTGNDTLRIISATSSSTVFSSHLAAMRIPPGGSIIDSIKFLPTTVGTISDRLLFVTNAVTSPDTISVYGNGVNVARAAILATSSRTVNCGTTPIGTPTWTLITLSNTGNDTLRISSATSNSATFSSHLSETVLAPGASVIDLIVFLPWRVGAHAGQLLFTTNALIPHDTIAVYGIGTVPTSVNDATSPASYRLGAIYPNPLFDAAELQLTMQSGERLLHAGMYDMLGHELQDWTTRIAPSGALSLHLGSYPVGEYFVRLHSTFRVQVLPLAIVR